ncbi:hypothetical protein GALL_535390 [mine drainage metagenome]|uniref:Uncharacterized protein n=1 Tax=mine drainage metagenome TaxID=410659 RepID=A0A1J5PMW3_9ZZZZ
MHYPLDADFIVAYRGEIGSYNSLHYPLDADFIVAYRGEIGSYNAKKSPHKGAPFRRSRFARLVRKYLSYDLAELD